MSSEPLRPLAGERQPERPINPGVKIGHVHLKVADLDRALGFYCGVLGFDLMQRYGTQAAFSQQAGITTTSASTPGRAWAAHHPLRAARASSTRPFCIRPDRRWPM